MKTGITDDGSFDDLSREMQELSDAFGDAIKNMLRACAEKVSVTARGKYLRGPKPQRLRSRVGAATGFGGERPSGGGRLERSLIVGGGGYEHLARMHSAGGDSIFKYVATGGDEIALEYGTKVSVSHKGTGYFYGALWEYGPAVRIIRPRTAKVLTFKTESGQWVSKKEVRQSPGRRPFLEPALKDEEDKFPGIFEKFLGKVIDRHGAN